MTTEARLAASVRRRMLSITRSFMPSVLNMRIFSVNRITDLRPGNSRRPLTT